LREFKLLLGWEGEEDEFVEGNLTLRTEVRAALNDLYSGQCGLVSVLRTWLKGYIVVFFRLIWPVLTLKLYVLLTIFDDAQHGFSDFRMFSTQKSKQKSCLSNVFFLCFQVCIVITNFKLDPSKLSDFCRIQIKVVKNYTFVRRYFFT